MDRRMVATVAPQSRDAGVVVSVATAREALLALRMSQLRHALERHLDWSAKAANAADELEAALAHPVPR